MNPMKHVVWLIVGVLPVWSVCTDVLGAETTLGLITRGDDTWDLWAWTSSGDNDGITGYRVEMTGTNLVGNHEAPMWAAGGDHAPWDGFIVGREDIPNSSTDNTLSAQIPFPSPYPADYPFSFFGVGSPDLGNRVMASPGIPLWPSVGGIQIPWGVVGFNTGGTNPFFVRDYSVLLASGLGSWRDVNIGTVTEIDVYSAGDWANTTDTRGPSDVTLFVTRVPEPRAWITGVILVLVSTVITRRRAICGLCSKGHLQ